jgi:hypothetical protein
MLPHASAVSSFLLYYAGAKLGLTLKEDNNVLRKISGSKSKRVTGYWRKLHNEKLRDLYRRLNSTRRIK